jgi:hypothetical protein
MLLEIVVSCIAVVLATRMSLFQDNLRKTLFYAGIAALGGVIGPWLRGYPASALVIGPASFAMTAGAIQLFDYLERRSTKRQ